MPLLAIAGLFGAAMVWLVVASLIPHDVPTYEPRERRNPSGVDTVTIDARDPDRWRFYGFSRGFLTPPDTAGWDLAVRRFHVIAAGGVVRLESRRFDSGVVAPVAGHGFIPV